jgi:hypothetical protein
MGFSIWDVLCPGWTEPSACGDHFFKFLKNDWTFTVTPYFWFADIGATIQHGSAGGSKETNVKVGTDDYIGNLEMAFPLDLEAREGRWFIVSDFLYMRLAGETVRLF